MSLGKVVCSIPAKHKTHPSYFHRYKIERYNSYYYNTFIFYSQSFGMTQNYFVFVEIPYCVNVAKVVWNTSLGRPALDAFKFYSNEKVNYYKLPLIALS